MKSVGGPLHQRILRFGGRFIAGITPIAARAGADSVTGKPSATPDHNVRRVFFDGIYGTGFTLCPPLEIGLMSRLDQGRSVGWAGPRRRPCRRGSTEAARP
jgi:hypothetical protein